MEHAPAHNAPAATPTAPTGKPSPNDSYLARGIAGASVGLGYFSAVVFFWTPFSSMLAAVGLVLGAFSVGRGVKGGLRGENYAMVGTILCSASLGVSVTLTQGLRYVQWDKLPYLW